MNDQDKKTYLEKYHAAKKKGVPFFPDIIFKDTVVALIIFIVLVALAYFAGAPLEPRANPADTSYTPRPEWYFLFLFQLLKYFPGNLEVLGVVVLPALVIAALFFLPYIDRGPLRHFRNRPVIVGGTALMLAGIIFLTVQAVRESPPPAEAASGDPIAALYVANCAPCHGESLKVPPGTNLHQIIAEGKHTGMPAWGADLSTDQIDALAGFILSPSGNQLFAQDCGACHTADQLVSTNPAEIKKSLDQGLTYPAHAGANIPDFSTAMDADQRSRLLNFLAAPDGERLFATNCTPCHGSSIAFSGTEDELRALINQGGLHLEMPSWQAKLSASEIDVLAGYVVDPKGSLAGKQSFDKNCQSCHGDRIPSAPDLAQARQIITTGGSHQTMPVWGDILTAEQMDALVKYTFQVAQGGSAGAGQQLFAKNCAPCHGAFGEGGPMPGRPGYMIWPINTTEFLKVRDDATLQAIIAQGQPDMGMSPFGSAFGGPLEDDEINAIVAFLRTWQENPPNVAPPTLEPAPTAAPTGGTIPGGALTYDSIAPFFTQCAACHNSSMLAADMDLTTYAGLMKGGKDGVVITPNDSANSLLVKIQSAQHFANLSADELTAVKQWIDAGAPEK